ARGSAALVPRLGGALDAIEHAELTGVLGQPALQQTPLPQQGLVRRLDGDLAADGNVGGEQALIDEMIDQRARVRRDLRPADNGRGGGPGAPVSGSPRAGQGITPCRSSASRAWRSRGMFRSESAVSSARSTAASIEPLTRPSFS